MRLLIASLLAVATATATAPAMAYVPLVWLVTGNNNFMFDGLDLNDADRTMAMDSQASLLANADAKPGTATAWSNAQTGNSGTVVYVKALEYGGMPCRGIEHRVMQRGLSDPMNYRIVKCQAPDGAWKTL